MKSIYGYQQLDFSFMGMLKLVEPGRPDVLAGSVDGRFGPDIGHLKSVDNQRRHSCILDITVPTDTVEVEEGGL